MNIRILSGILLPKTANGVATISFNPFGITGDADAVDPRSVGPTTNFKTVPGKIVSLRKIMVADKNTFLGGSEDDLFSIEDHFANINTLVVKWWSSGGSQIKEISFMVIGEVE